MDKLESLKRGSEWGHLDNTKHLIFWLCNMKQLNFRHFNTNRKKFTVTVNFGQKETKTAPKRPILFCLVYQDVFSHFPTIPDHLWRFPKNTEDSRSLPMISEDYRRFPRRNPKIFDYISSLYSQVKDLFLRFTMLNKNDVIPSLSKAHGYVPYLIVQMFPQIKAIMSADGTARSADR